MTKQRVKKVAKQGGIAIAILSTLGTGFSQYVKLEEAKLTIAKEKTRQDQFEIFFSNEQDKIYCMLDSIKIKKCNQ